MIVPRVVSGRSDKNADITFSERIANDDRTLCLTGYMYHLQSNDGNHAFAKGAIFKDIILHYQFDKKLRALPMDYLERDDYPCMNMMSMGFPVTWKENPAWAKP